MKKRICMTGKGHKTRPELKKDLEDMGYEVVNVVDSRTHILLCEDKNRNTVKLQKARALGVEILNYNDIF